MTLLEVVLAVAILALITATVTGALTYFYGSQTRQQRQLAAAELANRLMMMHLDDENSVKALRGAIAYGSDEYRFSLVERPIQVRPTDALRQAIQEQRRQTPVSIDRLKQITVRVWLGEQSGGSFSIQPGVPQAILNRLIDPLGFTRNSDSAEHKLTDPDFISTLLEQIGASP